MWYEVKEGLYKDQRQKTMLLYELQIEKVEAVLPRDLTTFFHLQEKTQAHRE